MQIDGKNKRKDECPSAPCRFPAYLFLQQQVGQLCNPRIEPRYFILLPFHHLGQCPHPRWLYLSPWVNSPHPPWSPQGILHRVFIPESGDLLLAEHIDEPSILRFFQFEEFVFHPADKRLGAAEDARKVGLEQIMLRPEVLQSDVYHTLSIQGFMAAPPLWRLLSRSAGRQPSGILFRQTL